MHFLLHGINPESTVDASDWSVENFKTVPSPSLSWHTVKTFPLIGKVLIPTKIPSGKALAWVLLFLKIAAASQPWMNILVCWRCRHWMLAGHALMRTEQRLHLFPFLPLYFHYIICISNSRAFPDPDSLADLHFIMERDWREDSA